MLRIIFVIGLCLLFWLICYLNTGSDKNNMIGFRSYTKEVNMTKVLISNYLFDCWIYYKMDIRF